MFLIVSHPKEKCNSTHLLIFLSYQAFFPFNFMTHTCVYVNFMCLFKIKEPQMWNCSFASFYNHFNSFNVIISYYIYFPVKETMSLLMVEKIHNVYILCSLSCFLLLIYLVCFHNLAIASMLICQYLRGMCTEGGVWMIILST